MIVDKKKPDRFEIIGSLVVACGAIIIFYTPVNNTRKMNSTRL
jgi:drug/metabolite transporter superfamily protein YnfA